MPKNIPLTILSDSCARTRGCLHLNSESTILMKGDGKKSFSCGSCGAILLANVDRFVIQNTAGKCNKCGTYNSLEKISVYKRAPKTIKNLDNDEEPKKHFKMSGVWPSHHLSRHFENISNKILNDWDSEQGKRPKVLYHYTNFNGLSGIMGNEKVWFTDIAYLNDALEMQIGIDLIKESFEKFEKNLDEPGKELLRRASVSTSPKDTSIGFYVACFCQDGDLLSQWRSYGAGGGGYALGFNAKDIGRNDQIQLRKVIYTKSKQVQFIDKTVGITLQLFNSISNGRTIKQLDEDNTLPAFASFLSDHLREFLCCFKHESFKEENEWRAIFDFNRSRHTKNLKFRSNQGFPIPYLDLAIGNSEAKMPQLPLIEIVHGPTLHPQLTEKSLNLLLELHNYEFVELRGSISPLRV